MTGSLPGLPPWRSSSRKGKPRTRRGRSRNRLSRRHPARCGGCGYDASSWQSAARIGPILGRLADQAACEGVCWAQGATSIRQRGQRRRAKPIDQGLVGRPGRPARLRLPGPTSAGSRVASDPADGSPLAKKGRWDRLPDGVLPPRSKSSCITYAPGTRPRPGRSPLGAALHDPFTIWLPLPGALRHLPPVRFGRDAMVPFRHMLWGGSQRLELQPRGGRGPDAASIVMRGHFDDFNGVDLADSAHYAVADFFALLGLQPSGTWCRGSTWPSARKEWSWRPPRKRRARILDQIDAALSKTSLSPDAVSRLAGRLTRSNSGRGPQGKSLGTWGLERPSPDRLGGRMAGAMSCSWTATSSTTTGHQTGAPGPLRRHRPLSTSWRSSLRSCPCQAPQPLLDRLHRQRRRAVCPYEGIREGSLGQRYPRLLLGPCG